MNKTKEQKHNEMLDKIITPEIERLKKVEVIAVEILNELKEKGYIHYWEEDKCYLIDIIQRIISKNN